MDVLEERCLKIAKNTSTSSSLGLGLLIVLVVLHGRVITISFPSPPLPSKSNRDVDNQLPADRFLLCPSIPSSLSTLRLRYLYVFLLRLLYLILLL
ncbi:hypothetical protein AMTR_s00021p00160490 [Amborella trichopoda]|uniref:Uncharacterized protein n=1 Tax=Amborella trichopoda TaxID=13333 RepID=W1Q0D6_AMBTC|nr:hypothetical protein AMTR_s00021p00160490 [Amborella trichopoda]